MVEKIYKNIYPKIFFLLKNICLANNILNFETYITLDLFCIIENLFGIPKLKAPLFLFWVKKFHHFGDPKKMWLRLVQRVYIFGKNGSHHV
jgi:hypothetical protein